MAQGPGDLFSDTHHAETMSMPELERGIAKAQFFPETVDAEARRVFGGVVKQDDAAARKLRQPGLEIAPHRRVAMAAVDVQKVDAAVREFAARVGKIGADQARERIVASIVG